MRYGLSPTEYKGGSLCKNKEAYHTVSCGNILLPLHSLPPICRTIAAIIFCYGLPLTSGTCATGSQSTMLLYLKSNVVRFVSADSGEMSLM